MTATRQDGLGRSRYERCPAIRLRDEEVAAPGKPPAHAPPQEQEEIRNSCRLVIEQLVQRAGYDAVIDLDQLGDVAVGECLLDAWPVMPVLTSVDRGSIQYVERRLVSSPR